MNIRKLTLILFLSLGLIAPVAAQTPPDEITLNLRVRDAKTGQVVIKPLKIDPRKVGIVIVDPWNYHWCMTYTHRLLATVPRMDRSLQCARRLGMTVMWAPTEAASQYAGCPQRERAAAVPLVEVPRVRSLQCKFAPRQGACTCGPGVACEVNYGLDGICSQLAIEADDLIVSNQQETYSLCKQRGLTHILFMGWAANICLFGRPEGIESMYTTGLECYLARDLTDAYDHYDPAVPLTCDDATAAAVVQLEKAGIATFDMVEEMRKAGQWNDAWTVECVRITPWGAADRPYLFERQVVVTLTCPLLADTRIRYTLDGQEPTADSTLYEKPFALAGSMTLRAAAFRADRKVSLTSVGRFVRLGAMPPRPDVYLDQVMPITETYPFWYSSWRPVLNRSIEDKSLLLRGRTYAKGLGMRAPCNMRYPLKPEYDRFVALAGIDGNLIQADKERYGIFPGGQGRRTGGGGGMGCLMAQQPHVQFRVFIDGNLAAESPLLRIGQEPWRFDVPIPANARQINLTATDGGQRSLINYADWVEAGFVLKKK
jgi:hypothetical protein